MDVVHEAELRILEIDRETIEGRLAELNAKKVFDGRLDTAYLEKGEPPTYKQEGKFFRIRHVDGLVYLVGGQTNVSKRVIYTERAIKTKLSVSNQDSGLQVITDGKVARILEETVEARYEGRVIDDLVNEELSRGHYVKAREKKKRVSYLIDNVRFEFDSIYSTLALGDREIPLFLEIESPDSRLTMQAVVDLGYNLSHQNVVDWNMRKIIQHYADLWNVKLPARS